MSRLLRGDTEALLQAVKTCALRVYLMADGPHRGRRAGDGPSTVGWKRPEQVPDEPSRLAWMDRQGIGGDGWVGEWWLVEAESANAARETIAHIRPHDSTSDGGDEEAYEEAFGGPGRILASGGQR